MIRSSNPNSSPCPGTVTGTTIFYIYDICQNGCQNIAEIILFFSIVLQCYSNVWTGILFIETFSGSNYQVLREYI